MAKSPTKLKCSNCGKILLTYSADGAGAFDIDCPPWGAVAQIIDADKFIYDVACADCRGVERFEPGARLFGQSPTSSLAWVWPSNKPLGNALLPVVKVDVARKLARHYVNFPLLRECTSAFSANIARVAGIANVSISVAGLSRKLRSLEDTQRRAYDGTVSRGQNFNFQSAAGLHFRNVLGDKRLLFKYPLKQNVRVTIEELGHDDLLFWADTHKDILDGLTTLLSAQISLAWSAFEILAADLWVAAVNWEPNPLAVRFAESGQGNAQGKSIAVSALAQYGSRDFNLSGLMGDVLRDTKADFTSLKSTTFAYQRTFDVKVPILELPELKLLEFLRNLILHKAGIADGRFLKGLNDSGIRKTISDLPELEEGNAFPLTAKLTGQLIDGAISQGAQLVDFVCHYFWPKKDPKTDQKTDPADEE